MLKNMEELVRRLSNSGLDDIRWEGEGEISFGDLTVSTREAMEVLELVMESMKDISSALRKDINVNGVNGIGKTQ